MFTGRDNELYISVTGQWPVLIICRLVSGSDSIKMKELDIYLSLPANVIGLILALTQVTFDLGRLI